MYAGLKVKYSRVYTREGGVLDPQNDRGVTPEKMERTPVYLDFLFKWPVFTAILSQKNIFTNDFRKVRPAFRDIFTVRAARPYQPF